MAAKKKTTTEELDVNLRIDDETLEELMALEDERVVKLVVWDESILDALDDNEKLPTVDVDVYLEDGVLFELYGVLCYPSLDEDPTDDPASILTAFVSTTTKLSEIAVDTEDDLVLVLEQENSGNQLYLNIGAWTVDGWEELPD